MLSAGAGVTLAVAAVTAGGAWPGAAGAATTSNATAPVTLSAAPLGIDVAPWDPVYSGIGKKTSPEILKAVQSRLNAAGVRQLHYGGGVSADQYDWQTNTDISSCPSTAFSEFTAKCAYKAGLPFSKLSANARAIGAQSFVTVNYGTGTADLAAAWVKQAASTAGQAVADWEIGNESYGCWEDNNWIPGYEPNVNADCPMVSEGTAKGMTTMADSYATNAKTFMTAMRGADPSAVIGVPWAFDWTVGGASVADNTEWNDTVLQNDRQYIGFVDAHWYPFGFGGDTGAAGNPTTQEVLQSVIQIPTEYANIRTTLNTYDPGAQVIVGETGVSYLATNVTCTPAGALFAAGDVLSWLASGAQSIDWWPLDTNANLGSTCANPDEGMFTNAGAPITPYYGYLLASALAQPNTQLSALTPTGATLTPANSPVQYVSGKPDVLAFQSVLPNGQVVVALINTNTGASQTVKVATALSGNLATESYSAGNQNAANSKIVTGTTTARAIAGGITLPPESILVLKSQAPSALNFGTAGSSHVFKAGTRVTLKGKLWLDHAAAPGGVPVKIHRHLAGSSKDSFTWTVRTGAGGTFSAANVPPASGNYVYVASYAGGGYAPASRSVTVRVVKAKPALSLTVSARSVRPGGKVRVTATLRAAHINRRLVIYAQPKGGAMTVIRNAIINRWGQLAAVYTVRKNTVFTVRFTGDAWYTPGWAAAAVRA